MQTEHDNLRAALLWSLEADEQDIGLKRALAVNEFWTRYNNFSEAADWFGNLLKAAREIDPNSLKIEALCAAGSCFWRLGKYPESRCYLEQAVSLARSGESEVDLERAAKWRKQRLCLPSPIRSTNRPPTFWPFPTLHSLARLRTRQGEWTEARQLMLEGLQIKIENGEKWGVAIMLHMMAEWLQLKGQSRQACTLLGTSDALLDSPWLAYAAYPAGRVREDTRSSA